MKLRKLQLENFRNYSRFDFDFSKNMDITVLVGPNGKGKTNFLEAIYILSLGRSFRTLIRDDLIEWEFDYMRCRCETENENEKTELEVFYTNYPKKQKNFKKNHVNMKNSEYLGNLITVLFHPEDLNMLYLSPSFRRRYLNILLSQTDKKYLDSLSKYKKILKQRNALLHEIRDKRFNKENTNKLEEDLSAWNEGLMEFGSMIIQKRADLTEFLNAKLEKIYRSISGKTEKVALKYKCNVKKDEKLEGIKQNYREKVETKQMNDIKNAKTSTGPHRDDLLFFINDKEISKSASRGEFRTLLLAIKLAEIEFIKEKTGKNPILLLDDVFSELDRKRQSHLLESIKNCQTIITATDINSLGDLAEKKENIEFVNLK